MNSFTDIAKTFGSTSQLKALTDTWQVVGSYLGLSGGFSFFVIFSRPTFQDTMFLSKDYSETIVMIGLSTSFALAYLGSGLCMTYIGNAAYLTRMVDADKCTDDDIFQFIKKTDHLLSIPAYTNFMVTGLTMFSLAVFSFSNYSSVMSITFAVVALLVTMIGFLISQKMMNARQSVIVDVNVKKHQSIIQPHIANEQQ